MLITPTWERDLDLKTFVRFGGKEYCVSTVQLPFDHGFGGTPLWYETMIFKAADGEITSYRDLYCQRYVTRAEAAKGHAEAVAALRDGVLELYGDKDGEEEN